MKILTSEQIRQVDKYTIEHEPITSINLMERAATKCTEWIIANIEKSKKIFVVCGLGNNGGDGLVIARHLHRKGYAVKTLIIKYSEKTSDDFSKNYERLKKLKNIKIAEIADANDFPEIKNDDVIIDAIFGSGLSKPVEYFAADVIEKINEANSLVIAIDFPSGLFSEDNSKNKFKNIIQADFTLTFQVPKLAFLFPENEQYVGEWVLLDIGLDKNSIEELSSSYFFIEENDIKLLLKHRGKYAHKGNFGHAIFFSGSFGKMGAAALGSKACLRSGAGLLTTHIPKCGYEIIQTSVPEAMCSVDDENNFLRTLPDISKYNAVAIGPGIGLEKDTQNLLKLLIQNSSVPVIFDADAINILAENKTWLSFIPKHSILTPHPGEFARLAGKPVNSNHRLELQKELSVKYGIYIIYKGAFTTISTPDGHFFFNSTGNPGMATGGSGDVLTGMLLGLKACGYSSFETCIIGTYMHGLAGDLAAEEKGEPSLIAGDIIENISGAFKKL
ncbi:MAG TPA: NAD(P)H-hydrate dehydratase [Bacteroidales bacterium]|nr:NAD(P)H-hydrate dehydratase [Bacteroidales bacterium]HPS16365.1 NAD(P)H-hydrate dehydratase [Bacteroidales bacterium]